MTDSRGDEDFQEQRRRMVERDLARRDIHERRVLDAFRSVPRENFVPRANLSSAYDDRALPIGEEQTISQPYIVALMTQLLDVEPGTKVLEVGTGSGYQTAILAHLQAEVYTIEARSSLAEQARENLEQLDFSGKVEVCVGDGTEGWAEKAPFERILVTAGAPEVPAPLKEQLASPGKMVIPVGGRRSQTMKVITKSSTGELSSKSSISCVFVPLVGTEGWDGETI